MQTISILPEPTAESLLYRATCGDVHATGPTPGQALDSLEATLPTTELETGATLVILQRFQPDRFFSENQQQRLRELMDQFHDAIALGTPLDPNTHAKLETLVAAELEANIQRSHSLLQQHRQTSNGTIVHTINGQSTEKWIGEQPT